MGYPTLYPAQVNSPATELAADLSMEASEIIVKDAAILPAPPNLLVIGEGTDAETVLMTARTENRLTVQRANQGNANVWLAGALIRRAFTAGDHDAMREWLQSLKTDTTAALDPSAIVSALLDVDGVGSGLDAEYLAGKPLSDLQTRAERGKANGYAALDKDAKLPAAQLPAHTHAQGDVTGLAGALAGKAEKVHTHGTGDVTGLETELGKRALAQHTHATKDVTGLQTALDAKAAKDHTHTIGAVDGLQAAVDGKANAQHEHAVAEVKELQAALDRKAGATHTHAAAAVSFSPPAGMTATDTQAAVAELFQSASSGKTGIAAAIGEPAQAGDTFQALAGHVQAGKAALAAGLQKLWTTADANNTLLALCTMLNDMITAQLVFSTILYRDDSTKSTTSTSGVDLFGIAIALAGTIEVRFQFRSVDSTETTQVIVGAMVTVNGKTEAAGSGGQITSSSAWVDVLKTVTVQPSDKIKVNGYVQKNNVGTVEVRHFEVRLPPNTINTATKEL